MKKSVIYVLAAACLALTGGCSGSNTQNLAGSVPAETRSTVTETAEGITVKAATMGNAQTAELTAAGSAVSVSSDYIGEEAAKAAALQHAGLNESEVTFIKSRLDRENRQMVYEIEFYSENTEYDYEVDAYTGDILTFDYDAEQYFTDAGNKTGTITSDEAKQISLDRAGLTAAQVTYREVSFDYEDGRAVYQIEFIADGKEYELEISAADGSVLEYSVESHGR